MMTTSGNGKIRKRKVKGGYAFTFSIVRHVRIMGRASYQTLAHVGSVKERDIPACSENFWRTVEAKIDELVKTNQLWKNDADKVRKQFQAIVPLPMKPRTAQEILAERGIHL